VHARGGPGQAAGAAGGGEFLQAPRRRRLHLQQRQTGTCTRFSHVASRNSWCIPSQSPCSRMLFGRFADLCLQFCNLLSRCEARNVLSVALAQIGTHFGESKLEAKISSMLEKCILSDQLKWPCCYLSAFASR
jgi:hypothetical protein